MLCPENATVTGFRGVPGATPNLTATAETGNPGTSVEVERSGPNANPVLHFTIPGSAQVSVGAVTTLTPGSQATVVDGNPDPFNVELNFGIPRGDPGLNGTGAVVSTVADLRAAPNNGTATTLGCNAAGDGGGGLWRYSATSTATDNTGTVVKPTAIASNAPGRWLRAYQKNEVEASWFGTVGDGVADDTAAVNAAISFLGVNGGKVILRGPIRTGNLTFPALTGMLIIEFSGTWWLSETLVVPRYVTIDGGLGGGIEAALHNGAAQAMIRPILPSTNISPMVRLSGSSSKTLQNLSIRYFEGIGVLIGGTERMCALSTLRNVGIASRGLSDKERPLVLDSAYWVIIEDCSIMATGSYRNPSIWLTVTKDTALVPTVGYTGIVYCRRTIIAGAGVLLDSSQQQAQSGSFYFDNVIYESCTSPFLTIRGKTTNCTFSAINFTSSSMADPLGLHSFIHIPDFTGADGTRRSSQPYTILNRVLWPTGTAVWECTTAGTTASSVPSVPVSPAIGDTVTDGTVVWTVVFTQTSVTAIRANSTAYVENDLVTWTATNLSVWKCVTAGTTASSAPSITSAIVGDATAKFVTDGTVVWEVIYFPCTVRDVRLRDTAPVPFATQISGPVTGAYFDGMAQADYGGQLKIATDPTTQKTLVTTYAGGISGTLMTRGSDMAPSFVPGTAQLVPQVLSDAAKWVPTNATVTQTAAPDGSDQAWTVTATAATGLIAFTAYPAQPTLTTGDAVITGVWVQGTQFTAPQVPTITFLSPDMKYDTGSAVINLSGPELLTMGGDWRCVADYRIVRDSGTGYFTYALRAAAGKPTAYFNPFILIIPALSFSNREDLIRIVRTITTVPPSSSQGDIAVLDHQKLRLGGGVRVISASAAPSTGTWKRGDVVYNTTPSSAGYVGWVCTVAGTPGTWKEFGLIA